MQILPVISNLPVTVGFGSVALPASAAFAQLPNIPCDEIEIGLTTNAITIAASATPAGNALQLGSNVAGFPVFRTRTGGNASNLFVANTTAVTAQTVGFKYQSFSRGY
jgi:hypothetical protein